MCSYTYEVWLFHPCFRHRPCQKRDVTMPWKFMPAKAKQRQKVWGQKLINYHTPQCFWILIFSQDIWRNVHYVPEINFISQGTLINVFISIAKQKKFETRFCRWKTAEHNNAKINLSPNIPYNFSEAATGGVL